MSVLEFWTPVVRRIKDLFLGPGFKVHDSGLLNQNSLIPELKLPYLHGGD